MSTLEELWRSWLGANAALFTTFNAPLSGAVTQFIRAWGQFSGQVGLFNIHLGNSGSPATEVDVLTEFSYGRQLGRILDVLTPIIQNYSQSPSSQPKIDRQQLDDYLYMVKEIDKTKEKNSLFWHLNAIDELRKKSPPGAKS